MTRIFVRGTAVAVSVTLFIFAGCAPERVDPAYAPSREFSRFRHALQDLGVDASEIGSRWMEAGENALESRAEHELPLSESVIFDPAEPEAAVYRFNVDRRRTVLISVEGNARAPLLFADLYRLAPDGDQAPQKVASLNREDGRIEFRTRRSGIYLFRLQPEIARGGEVHIRMEAIP